MGITHFDEAPRASSSSVICAAAGRCSARPPARVNVGVRRIQVPAGGWSTPAHEHGREEEIFYVLAGRGLSLAARDGRARSAPATASSTCRGRGAHSLHALEELDVLAFGPREHDESVGFPRLGMSLRRQPGGRDRARRRSTARRSSSFANPSSVRRSCPPTRAPRPATIVNVDDVEPQPLERPRVVRDPAQPRPRGRLASAPGCSTSRSRPARSRPRSTATRSRRRSS